MIYRGSEIEIESILVCDCVFLFWNIRTFFLQWRKLWERSDLNLDPWRLSLVASRLGCQVRHFPNPVWFLWKFKRLKWRFWFCFWFKRFCLSLSRLAFCVRIIGLIMMRLGFCCVAVARFDFSWGDCEYHQETLQNLKAAVKATKKLCAVSLDCLLIGLIVCLHVFFFFGYLFDCWEIGGYWGIIIRRDLIYIRV